MKALALFLVAVMVMSCGPGGPKVVSVELEEEDLLLRQAEAFVEGGHYQSFKRAVRAYGDLYAKRYLRSQVAAPYTRALLLLALREKQIGLDNPSTMEIAEQLIQTHSSLSSFEPHALLIASMPLRTKGVLRDIDTRSGGKAEQDRIAAAEEDLRGTARQSEFSAYVLASWLCSFGPYSERWRDPEAWLKVYPDSLLLKYADAICGGEKTAALEELLEREPAFVEVHYHLGEAALAEQNHFQAEEHLVKAFEVMPESPQPRILLAGIYFATEEFTKSIRFYDLTLQVAPEYRDALLGKAICLGYLKRHDESIEVLDKILALGYWMLGEGHYWMAWNLHELERDADARDHILEAKGRLPDNTHVFGLAGTIALEMGDLETAEKEFLESVRIRADNTESLFGLGTVHTKKNNWASAAGFFDQAGRAFEGEAAALQADVEKLRFAAIAVERKNQLIQKRNSQLERIRLTEATSDYNAAAAYLNAGQKDKARETATKAAAHPTLKEKAEELLRAIK